MKAIRFSMVLGAVLAAGLLATPASRAQIGFSVQVGPPPVCPYGYYDYAPYNCAPYGYYGPEWFQGGAFIGAGPWFRGDPHFHGWVDRHYDPHYGYHGGFPHRGDQGHWHNYGHGQFHGNAMRDGRGHDYHGGGHGH